MATIFIRIERVELGTPLDHPPALNIRFQPKLKQLAPNTVLPAVNFCLMPRGVWLNLLAILTLLLVLPMAGPGGAFGEGFEVGV